MAEETRGGPADEVAPSSGGGWSDLIRKEDYWAIWLGFLMLAVGLLIFLPNPPPVCRRRSRRRIARSRRRRPGPVSAPSPGTRRSWRKRGSRRPGEDLAKSVRKLVSPPHKWTFPHVLDAFVIGEGRAAERNEAAQPKAREARERAR